MKTRLIKEKREGDEKRKGKMRENGKKMDSTNRRKDTLVMCWGVEGLMDEC
jgi:hypothetical protein